ncbi:ABC transporter substrate-binding protein [Deinococcus marmoris]|uniref:ABC transporter substrate-binding protein n=1 Tax=Deinococcus marmoris TaxID=249408 RepID=UPI000496FAB6|nr:ABC transporter substrate-binding protein [Deinococcus marmoris]
MNTTRLVSLSFILLASMGAHAQNPSPVKVNNCGQALTFAQAPQRVITTYSVTTELMLRLGLGDRIVGAANFGEAMPADLQTAYTKLNRIGANYRLPKEITLSLRPDFVFDNQPNSAYDGKKGNATQAELRAAGAQLYTLTAKCGGGRVGAKFEDIYTDLNNLGRIFGVESRARAVVADMSKTVAGVRARVAGRPPVRVMMYSDGEGPVGVYGPGPYDNVLKLAGAVNVFGDLKDIYAQLSVEEIAVRDFDAFVILSAEGNEKQAMDFLLRTFPNSKAAKNKRVVAVAYELVNPGVRSHLGVERLARGLHPEAFRR